MRTPLPKGYELKINTDSSQVGIIIGDVIGEGGCCISYKGEMLMEPHLPVIVKECFPLNLPIERRLILNSADKDDYSLIFENEEQEGREKERFDARKDMFKRGILHNASVSRLNYSDFEHLKKTFENIWRTASMILTYAKLITALQQIEKTTSSIAGRSFLSLFSGIVNQQHSYRSLVLR